MVRQGRFPLRSRRLTDWGFGPDDAIFTFTATSAQLWDTGVQISTQKATFVRLRGMFHAFLTVSTAAGDGFFGAVGIGVVTQQAFTAG